MESNTYNPGSTYFDESYPSSMELGSTSFTTPLNNSAPIPYSISSFSNSLEGQIPPFDEPTPLHDSVSFSQNAVEDQILPFDDFDPLPYLVSSPSNAAEGQIPSFEDLTPLPFPVPFSSDSVEGQIPSFDDLTPLPYPAPFSSDSVEGQIPSFDDLTPLPYPVPFSSDSVEGQIPPFEDLAPLSLSVLSFSNDTEAQIPPFYDLAPSPCMGPSSSNTTKIYPNAFEDHTSGFPNISMTQGPLQYVDGDVAYYQTGAPVYRGDDLSAHYGENPAMSAPQNPFDLGAQISQAPATATTQYPFINPSTPGPIPSLHQTSLDIGPTSSTSSKGKRKARPEKDLLPDILSNDTAKVKRAKNTEAARKSRAKRLQRERQLEQHVRRMSEEMKRWDAVAAGRSEEYRDGLADG